MSEAMIDMVANAILIGMMILVMLAMIAWLTRRPQPAQLEPCEEALPIVVEPTIAQDRITTPDEAREHMLTNRELACKTMYQAVEQFCDDGNAEGVMVIVFDPRADAAMVAELLEYERAGWNVTFAADHAAVSLPAVLS